MTKEEFLRSFREQEIFGSVNDREAWLLHGLARGTPRAGTAVEIGSWLGRSSIAIAMGLRESGARLHTVDDHRGLPGAPVQVPLGARAREMFFDNIRRAGVSDLIEHHNASSDDLAREWKLPIDLLFIDGCHDYEATKHDALNYASHVKPGGVVVFHDVALPSVWRAVNEWVGENDVAIAGVARTSNIVAFKLGSPEIPGARGLRRAFILSLMSHSRRETSERPHGLKRICCKLMRNSARRLLRLFDWRVDA